VGEIRETGQLGAGRTKVRGIVDVAMLQTLARKDDLTSLVGGYGLVVADECHHIPAAAFEHAVNQIPARRWLGLTATPYRRDKLAREHARKDVARYIEFRYNLKRLHSALAYRTPRVAYNEYQNQRQAA